MATYTVYKHTSPSGKVYIGITARPVSRRWHGGSAYRGNQHFYAAIKKYGWENFKHEILAEGLSYEEACAKEISLIEAYQSTNPEKGYNRSHGGDKTTLGYTYSEEGRRHISEAMKGKRKGIPHTKEHSERISQALIGHKVSEETREKFRTTLGDRFNTEEARKKQRENTPKREKHHKATAIKCMETGEVFPTIQDAADKYGIHRANISAVCRGLQISAGGYHWEYIKISE